MNWCTAKQKLMLTAGLVTTALGGLGFLFGINGNHIAPILLLLLGAKILRDYQSQQNLELIRSDVLASPQEVDDYSYTRLGLSPITESGKEGKLVIDQGNLFVPQRLRKDINPDQTLFKRYWPLDRFIRRMNELARRSISFIAKLDFPESLRIRLVKYISSAAPP